MTDEELADIARRLEHDERFIAAGIFYAEDALTTPADVRALLTKNAALREIVQSVADLTRDYRDGRGYDEHAVEDIQERARALLAKEDGE